MELTYHYATFHRLWDFITISMIGAHYDASIPFLTADDYSSRLAVAVRELRVSMPAAASATTVAPAGVIQVGTLTSVKLQPAEEGYVPGFGGTLITLHDVAVLIDDASAAGTAVSSLADESEDTPGVEATAADTVSYTHLTLPTKA